MSSGSWHALHIHHLAVKHSDLCDDKDSDHTQVRTIGISVQLLKAERGNLPGQVCSGLLSFATAPFL